MTKQLIKGIVVIATLLLAMIGIVDATINQWEFTGGTGAQFKSFVSSHGQGTYVLTGDVVISTPLVMDNMDNINIIRMAPSDVTGWVFDASGQHPPPANDQATSPRFLVTMNSGTAVSVTRNNVVFKDIPFVSQTPTSFVGVMTYLDSTAKYSKFDNCGWIAGNGCAITINGAFAPSIIKPNIVLKSGGYGIMLLGHTTSLYLEGDAYGKGIFDGLVAMFVQDAEGIIVHGLMSYNCQNGLYIMPINNNILNLVFDETNFDSTFNGGSPVATSDYYGDYLITRLFFQNCWMFSGVTGGPVYNFNTRIDYLSIVGELAIEGNPAQPWLYEKRAVTHSSIAHVLPSVP